VFSEKKNAPMIIFLHGCPGYSHPHIEHLVPLAKEFDLLFYDRGGCGKSLKAKITPHKNASFLDTEVADLKCIKDHITKRYTNDGNTPKKIIIMGHSMGTVVSSLFAARYPNEADMLVLTAPVPIDPFKIQALLGQGAHASNSPADPFLDKEKDNIVQKDQRILNLQKQQEKNCKKQTKAILTNLKKTLEQDKNAWITSKKKQCPLLPRSYFNEQLLYAAMGKTIEGSIVPIYQEVCQKMQTNQQFFMNEYQKIKKPTLVARGGRDYLPFDPKILKCIEKDNPHKVQMLSLPQSGHILNKEEEKYFLNILKNFTNNNLTDKIQSIDHNTIPKQHHDDLRCARNP
jgi:pimeloyl-ACP methyl ester carboxylesterase